MRLHRVGLAFLATWVGFSSSSTAVSGEPVKAARYFKIKVVDDRTSRGVPLVELRTVHNVRYFTDSNGIVAFHEPGLMDRKVFFFVSSHGYEFRKDGFGNAGVALDVESGGEAVIRIKRRNIAERLYRLTGGGIYRDSVLVGEPVPIRRPLLNGLVLGQDSALAVPWRGKIYWFWGDTNRPRYPLGLFHMSGATSFPPKDGGLDPALGVDFDYFVGKDGFSRKMAPLPGRGVVWIDGILTVRDEADIERLVGHYARMKDLGTRLEHGIVVYDEEEDVFKKRVQFDLDDEWRCPKGHPIRVRDGGEEYFLFPSPYAIVRVRADLAHLVDPSRYEAFTCLAQGTRYDRAGAEVERDGDGRLVYGWKRDTDPIDIARERELIEAGTIRREEARYQPRDVDTDAVVTFHRSSIRWNAFRKKWIAIAVQQHGSSSFLGEVWFAEAGSPTGPWLWAKKIVTHDKYTFYNPVHHAFFDQEGGRLIYFEGTYASTFSGNPDKTPRYDYNQIIYRLDLSDPRLAAPNKKRAPGRRSGPSDSP